MKQEDFKVIGVMSGTSLDGIDLAYLHFYKKENLWQFKILEAVTLPYSDFWRKQLNKAFSLKTKDLDHLNQEYTQFLATQIKQFIAHFAIQELDAICSHGHTVFHKPEKGITVQIGNLSIIAELLQKTVVCDFRIQDVALGGQGAPLVPIGDELLFSKYDYCLNLGGFSNISFNDGQQRKAFDICPVNIVLNFYAEKLGFDYDDNGEIARKGILNTHLLEKLDQIPFYKKDYPKSLGKEFISTTVFPIMDNYSLPNDDKMRTFVEHIANQITTIVAPKTKVLITGGGAYNSFLIQRMKTLRPDVNWIIPDDKLIQFKEALIFGFLGVLKLQNEINVLASVTGASKNHSSGIIYVFP